MRNIAIVMLLTSTSVWAESSLLENVAQQTAKDAVKAAAPATVQKMEAANQTLENAKAVKDGVVNAPTSLKEQAKQAAVQKASDAIPGEAKQAVETVKAADSVKNKVVDAPKVAKEKAKQKAAEKALDLLH